MSTPTYGIEREYDPRGAARASYADDGPRGLGWVIFAGTMLGLAGTYNTIEGILAISRSKVYAPNAVYVISDLRTWGWIVLVLGILEIIASLAVFAGSNLARW